VTIDLMETFNANAFSFSLSTEFLSKKGMSQIHEPCTGRDRRENKNGRGKTRRIYEKIIRGRKRERGTKHVEQR